MNREERIQSLIQKSKKLNEIREIRDLEDYNKSLQLQEAAEVIALEKQNPYYYYRNCFSLQQLKDYVMSLKEEF
jgi:hypothetical protein